MTQRYFRATEAVYEQARQTLDAAWGLPNDIGTTTCLTPASVAHRNSDGWIVIAVRSDFVEFSVAVDLLPQLLASGAAVEITEDEYRAALPQVP